MNNTVSEPSGKMWRATFVASVVGDPLSQIVKRRGEGKRRTERKGTQGTSLSDT